jgi:adenylate kinase
MVFLGPPGAGKGTQAAIIRDRYGIPHVSTGEIIRDAIAGGTPMGDKVRVVVESGKLVPDEMIGDIVAERLGREDARNGFLLDGFPRTIRQAEILENVMSARNEGLTAVIKLDVGDDQVVLRLSGRRVCAACGALSHTEFSAPKRPGVCDACGGRLEQRRDDREEVIRRRLSVYHEQTEPLVAHYAALGLLRVIDGDRPCGEVTRDVLAAIEGGAAA